MGENEDGLPTSAEEVDAALEELYGQILDENQEIMRASREKAREMLFLREVFSDQASRCEEIAALHIRGAQIVAASCADVLANEFAVEEEEEDGEEKGDD